MVDRSWYQSSSSCRRCWSTWTGTGWVSRRTARQSATWNCHPGPHLRRSSSGSTAWYANYNICMQGIFKFLRGRKGQLENSTTSFTQPQIGSSKFQWNISNFTFCNNYQFVARWRVASRLNCGCGCLQPEHNMQQPAFPQLMGLERCPWLVTGKRGSRMCYEASTLASHPR